MNEHQPEQIEKKKTIADDIRPLWKAAMVKLGGREFSQKYIAFAQQLKSKYPDATHRRAYHALIASTPYEEGIIEEDFPGEDSVVGFLQKIAQ